MSESPGAGGPPPDGPENDRVESRREDIDLRKPESLGVPEETPPGPKRKKFGTFGGVFTPTLLTILGVIMFLREGWVFGNAGLLGGLLIILLAFGITTATALSMSSIASNVRIGAGGAYAIIAQSLGLEMGGAIGIPRYLSQALAVTMYIFGFREGWLWIFPDHSPLLVDLVTFTALLGIAYRSAWLAIRVQYLIMAVLAAALVSVGMAAATGSMIYPIDNVGLWGGFPGAVEDGFPGTTFWVVFAVFFPASTGIMAGANMSGDLETPRRSIPVGTMAAIGVSLAIYLALGYWLVRSASPEELVNNYTVMIDKAYWGPAVLAGLLGATFSSALASLVGSGRILMAMGEHHVLPGGGWLGKTTEAGEPRNAMLVTGAVLLLSILLRDLNAVAHLVTMFFLITYLMLNGVLLVEQSLGLTSFRPRLHVPLWVPALGLLGSVFAMFVIEPTIAWVSLAIVATFYWILLRRRLVAPFADVRSGLFVSVAEWAAAKVAELPGLHERAWKPNLLVPTREVEEVLGCFDILTDIAHPNGTVKLMGLSAGGTDANELDRSLSRLARSFRERGVFATSTVIDAGRSEQGVPFAERLIAGMQTLRGAFFRPNIVFLRLREESTDAEGWLTREVDLRRIMREAAAEKVGVMIYAPREVSSPGEPGLVDVWIRDRAPDWRISWDVGNLDLSMLTGLKLQRNWTARLRVSMIVGDDADREKAEGFLADLLSLARMEAEIRVEVGDFHEWVRRTPAPDLSIFGLTGQPNMAFVRTMVSESRSTCLFVRDSGAESVVA